MQEQDLIKRLKDRDPRIRFAEYGYQTGSMSSLELSRNEFVRALATEEGAEKLTEITNKHRNQPCLYVFENVSHPQTRVSFVCFDWDDEGLVVYGSDYGKDWDGYAFGVSKKTKN